GIVDVSRLDFRKRRPVPDGRPGITSLDGTIEIVPMVEEAEWQLWRIGDIEVHNLVASLDQPEEGKRAIECADVGFRRDQSHGMAPQSHRPNGIPLIADASDLLADRKDDRTVSQCGPSDALPEHCRKASLKLTRRNPDRRGRLLDDNSRRVADISCAPALLDRRVTQPQIVS